jgi:hypothetical protein
MSKANVFDQSLFNLFDTLTRIEFAVQTNDRATNIALRIGEKTLQREKARQPVAAKHVPTFGTKSCLAVLNVFDINRKFFPYGSHNAHDGELLNLLREQEWRANAQALSATYEAMELFLQEFGGLAYFQGRHGKPKVNEKKRFHKAFPKSVTMRGLPQYYAKYVEWMCRHNSDELLDELRDAFPTFSSICANSWLGFDLIEYYAAVATSRHLIVHNGGRIGKDSLNHLEMWQREVVTHMVKHSVLTAGDIILPEKGDMTWILERVSGLAWALYKAVSIEFDMKIA